MVPNRARTSTRTPWLSQEVGRATQHTDLHFDADVTLGSLVADLDDCRLSSVPDGSNACTAHCRAPDLSGDALCASRPVGDLYGADSGCARPAPWPNLRSLVSGGSISSERLSGRDDYGARGGADVSSCRHAQRDRHPTNHCQSRAANCLDWNVSDNGLHRRSDNVLDGQQGVYDSAPVPLGIFHRW